MVSELWMTVAIRRVHSEAIFSHSLGYTLLLFTTYFYFGGLRYLYPPTAMQWEEIWPALSLSFSLSLSSLCGVFFLLLLLCFLAKRLFAY